ncbi:MAG TPA: MerR family transcriptional regulator [Gemmatimonadales bacterium]
MTDPLLTLRTYRALAPWSLKDLTSIACGILRASGVKPVNAAASTLPSERTIRFYVTRGLVTTPDGRGTAATYAYRHLLHVLAVKLRQMEGATLERIGAELRETSGDVLERRVAAALGETLPPPSLLPLADGQGLRGGRAGRAVAAPTDAGTALDVPGRAWRHIAVADGVEVTIRDDRAHLLSSLDAKEIVAALREILEKAGRQHPE